MKSTELCYMSRLSNYLSIYIYICLSVKFLYLFIYPSACLLSPAEVAAEVIVPLGEVIVPLGEVIVPLGEVIVPLGEVIVPLGEVIVPLGEVIVPLGEVIVPLGEVIPGCSGTSRFIKQPFSGTSSPCISETTFPQQKPLLSFQQSNIAVLGDINPFNRKSDQVQISTAPSPVILHHRVSRTGLFIVT